jgi:hypothetical protein
VIGRTLSTYRVVERLGAGGMGEVYLARDERLGRDVALKILPEGRLSDEGARSRFRKEAQALLRLSHPHVATLFDYGTADGVDFLVMERVGGQTLDVVLREGPLPERDVVRLGAQLSRGLSAAHEAGVIHRDLKPSNLGLTADGLLKVLDFGVARLVGEVLPAGNGDATATETGAGQVVGSPPYLSPEQLVGKEADARSDVYSAGACLYELATGRRPHGEKTGALLIDAILHESPPAARSLNPGVSEGLEAVLAKAMDKEPSLRHQTAKELLVDLERLQQGGWTASAGGPGRGPTRIAGRKVAVLLSLAGFTVAGAAAFVLREPPPPRITNVRPLGIGIPWHWAAYAGVLSWATDGQRLYYVAPRKDGQGGLFEVSVNGGESAEIPLPFSHRVEIFDFLPRESALLMGGTTELPSLNSGADAGDGAPVWLVPVPAGTPRRLGLDARHAAASPDARRLALVQKDRIVVVGRDGSVLETHDVGSFVFQVVWTPDGRRLRYNGPDPDETDHWWTWEREVGRAREPSRRLWPWANVGRFTPDGRHYLLTQVNFRDRRNDVAVVSEPRWPWSARPAPRALTSGPLSWGWPGPSADGRRLFAVGDAVGGELQRYDEPSGRLEPFLGGAAASHVDTSPDGQWVVWSSFPEFTLWKSRLDGSEKQVLSPAGWWVVHGRWSPDGRTISFVATPPDDEGRNLDPSHIYRVPAEGGAPEMLVAGPAERPLWDPCWLADGTLVYSAYRGDQPGLFRVDAKTRVVTPFPGGERFLYPKCSRGGDVLAVEYVADSPDAIHWVLQRGARTWRRLGPSSLTYPTWTRDGRAYVGFDVRSRHIERRRLDTGRLEVVADLADVPIVATMGAPWMGLAADDSPLVLRDRTTRDFYALDWEAP